MLGEAIGPAGGWLSGYQLGYRQWRNITSVKESKPDRWQSLTG